MNKNTMRARKAGFASLYDQNNNGTKIKKGGICDTSRPAGKRRWVGAEKAAKSMGQNND